MCRSVRLSSEEAGHVVNDKPKWQLSDLPLCHYIALLVVIRFWQNRVAEATRIQLEESRIQVRIIIMAVSESHHTIHMKGCVDCVVKFT